jgi:hemoglobin
MMEQWLIEQNSQKIELTVREFYKLLIHDPIVQHRFNDILPSLDSHLLLIIEFWKSVLLDTASYHGNAMLPHLIMHQKEAFTLKEFDVWLQYWKQSVTTNLPKEVATVAILRAESIANIMKLKMNLQD